MTITSAEFKDICIAAIDAAIRYLDSGGECALVGGVDSYLDLYLLATLDGEDRILADGVMNGFAPGEGAGFLLLCSTETAAQRGLKPLAEVCKPGLGQEPGHDGADQAQGTDQEHRPAEPFETLPADQNPARLGEPAGDQECDREVHCHRVKDMDRHDRRNIALNARPAICGFSRRRRTE